MFAMREMCGDSRMAAATASGTVHVVDVKDDRILFILQQRHFHCRNRSISISVTFTVCTRVPFHLPASALAARSRAHVVRPFEERNQKQMMISMRKKNQIKNINSKWRRSYGEAFTGNRMRAHNLSLYFILRLVS